MLRTLFTLSILFSLSACSFYENYSIRKDAEKIAQEKLKDTFKLEVRSTISSYHPRANDFAEFAVKKSEFKAGDIREITSKESLVEVEVRTLNPEVRQMLLEIVGKLEGKTANAFNFTDAMSLIKRSKPELEVFVTEKVKVSVYR